MQLCCFSPLFAMVLHLQGQRHCSSLLPCPALHCCPALLPCTAAACYLSAIATLTVSFAGHQPLACRDGCFGGMDVISSRCERRK